jgi:hypothetical protein
VLYYAYLTSPVAQFDLARKMRDWLYSLPKSFFCSMSAFVTCLNWICKASAFLFRSSFPLLADFSFNLVCCRAL